MKRLISAAMIVSSITTAHAQPMKMEAPPWPATKPKLTGAMASRTTIVLRDVDKSLKLYHDILGMQLSESIRNVTNPVLEWTLGFSPGEAMDFEVLRPAIDSPDVNANFSYLALIVAHIKKPDAPAVATEGRSPYGSMGLFILTPDADAAFNKVKAGQKNTAM